MAKRKVERRNQILTVSCISMQNLFDRKFPFLGQIKVQLLVNYEVQQHVVPANILYLKLIASAKQYFENMDFAQAVCNTCKDIKQVVGKNTRFEQHYNQKLKTQYHHFINFCQTLLVTTDQSKCDEIIYDFNDNKFNDFCIGQRELIKLKQILFRQKSWQQLIKFYDKLSYLNIDQEAWVGPYPDQFQDRQKSEQPQQSMQEVQEKNGQKNQAK